MRNAPAVLREVEKLVASVEHDAEALRAIVQLGELMARRRQSDPGRPRASRRSGSTIQIR